MIRATVTQEGIGLNFYVFGLRPLCVKFDFINKKIFVNGKTLEKRPKKKKKYKLIVSPRIIIDLGAQFFVRLQSEFDSFAKAMANGLFRNFPNRLKVSLTTDDKIGFYFSIYGKFTIFKIIVSVLNNTKIKRK